MSRSIHAPHPSDRARHGRKGVRAAAVLFLLTLAGCAWQVAYRTRAEELVRGHFRRPSDDLPPGDSLVVASYNIQFARRIDEALLDLESEPHLARADILLLQEMDPEGCERIARARHYDFVYYPSTIHTHHGRYFGNAILTRGRIDEPRFVALPRKGPLPVTSRIAVAADVWFGARKVRVVCLHASTIVVGRAARLIQVRTAVDSLAGAGGPMIFGGDFNTQGDDDTLAVADELRRGGLERVNLPRGSTIRKNPLRFIHNAQVLDHIFFREMRPRASGIYRAARASDHYPVWAVFDRVGEHR